MRPSVWPGSARLGQASICGAGQPQPPPTRCDGPRRRRRRRMHVSPGFPVRNGRRKSRRRRYSGPTAVRRRGAARRGTGDGPAHGPAHGPGLGKRAAPLRRRRAQWRSAGSRSRSWGGGRGREWGGRRSVFWQQLPILAGSCRQQLPASGAGADRFIGSSCRPAVGTLSSIGRIEGAAAPRPAAPIATCRLGSRMKHAQSSAPEREDGWGWGGVDYCR